MAHGVCFQAAVLTSKGDVPPVFVRNVTPLTIGLISTGSKCHPLLPRNLPYPIAKTLIGRTHRDNQPSGKVGIYEGEHSNITANQTIGWATLKGLPPSSKAEDIIKVRLQIDEKMQISISMVHEKSGNRVELEIQRPKCLTEEEIREMTKLLAERKEVATGKCSECALAKRMKIDVETNEVGDDDVCPIYDQNAEDEDVQSEIELQEN